MHQNIINSIQNLLSTLSLILSLHNTWLHHMEIVPDDVVYTFTIIHDNDIYIRVLDQLSTFCADFNDFIGNNNYEFVEWLWES